MRLLRLKTLPSAGMMCSKQCRLAGTEGQERGQDGGTLWGEALLGGPCYPQKRIAPSILSLLKLFARPVKDERGVVANGVAINGIKRGRYT